MKKQEKIRERRGKLQWEGNLDEMRDRCMIVADTSVWIDYVNGVLSEQTDMLDRELEQNRIATGDVIISRIPPGVS